jgi:hypothetical protein
MLLLHLCSLRGRTELGRNIFGDLASAARLRHLHTQHIGAALLDLDPKEHQFFFASQNYLPFRHESRGADFLQTVRKLVALTALRTRAVTDGAFRLSSGAT